MSIQANQLRQGTYIGGIMSQGNERVSRTCGGRGQQVTFALDLGDIPLYGSAQVRDFLDPTSVADVPFAYKRIPGE